MKVVYAKGTFFSGHSLIREGEHWPADDPVVLSNPESFSENPRYGLRFSGNEPPINEQTPEAPRMKRSYVRRA